MLLEAALPVVQGSLSLHGGAWCRSSGGHLVWLPGVLLASCVHLWSARPCGLASLRAVLCHSRPGASQLSRRGQTISFIPVSLRSVAASLDPMAYCFRFNRPSRDPGLPDDPICDDSSEDRPPAPVGTTASAVSLLAQDLRVLLCQVDNLQGRLLHLEQILWQPCSQPTDCPDAAPDRILLCEQQLEELTQLVHAFAQPETGKLARIQDLLQWKLDRLGVRVSLLQQNVDDLRGGLGLLVHTITGDPDVAAQALANSVPARLSQLEQCVSLLVQQIGTRLDADIQAVPQDSSDVASVHITLAERLKRAEDFLSSLADSLASLPSLDVPPDL